MSLTKKDKEEIKEIVIKVLREANSVDFDVIKSVESHGIKPKEEWSGWKKFCKKFGEDSKEIFIGSDYSIEFTKNDFVLPEDFELKNGTILKKGKRYFTWNEAKALEEELFKPNGLRLPTTQEFMFLHAECGLDKDGHDDPKMFYKRLDLENTGYIDKNDMDKYNEDPLDIKKNCIMITECNECGYWWSSDTTSSRTGNNLYVDFLNNIGYIYAQNYCCRGSGFSVRCVAC